VVDGFPGKSIGVVARIEPEAGHWVVYLDVSFWNEDAVDSPIETVQRRITSYPTRARAEVAANLMVRAAARNLPHPPLGF
jgi:hypothetical protein